MWENVCLENRYIKLIKKERVVKYLLANLVVLLFFALRIVSITKDYNLNIMVMRNICLFFLLLLVVTDYVFFRLLRFEEIK